MPQVSQNEDDQLDLNGVQYRVEYGGRYLKLQFAAITDDMDNIDGLVTVIQDITEEQKLDNMRREFVANVSHELRTPLTSVKSYTETLLDGARRIRPQQSIFLRSSMMKPIAWPVLLRTFSFFPSMTAVSG